MSAARWSVTAAAALLLAAGATSRASFDQAAVSDWRPVALQTFDVVWDTINTTFYDPTFGGVDWNAIRSEFRPRIERAASPDDTRAIIREMLARLGKSHMALLSAAPDNQAPSGPAVVPIDVRIAAGEVVISRVIPESNASRAGVRAGDRLDGVDGEQARDWFAAAEGANPRADLDGRATGLRLSFDRELAPVASPTRLPIIDHPQVDCLPQRLPSPIGQAAMILRHPDRPTVRKGDAKHRLRSRGPDVDDAGPTDGARRLVAHAK